MRCACVFLGLVASRSLRNQGGDVDLSLRRTADVWIPITQEDVGTFYFSPTLGRSVRELPHGAAEIALQLTTANGTAQIVPNGKRKSCVPHCAWSCTQSVCEQNCHPECGVPSCETRCPKTNSPNAFKDCKVKCGEPNCAMFCPPDPCEGKKSLDCETPKCTTRCEEPHCMLDCGSSELGCKTVCPSPQCEWKCQRPSSCPKPKCSMKCEVAPGCGKTVVAPPPPAAGMETVGPVRSAIMSDNHWIIGEWNKCSSQCGAGFQTRVVECNAGKDHYCSGDKAPTQQRCESVQACDYKVGPWTACSAKCGQGVRQREVVCEGKQCLGPRPVSSSSCTGRGHTCSECHMTVWGGEEFSGWQHTFRPGNYSGVELEYNGLKCDDVSSVEIVGEFCEATVFEYGDFNKLHPGWSTKLTQGKYTADQLISKGAKNNDISSFRLVHLGQQAPKHDTTKKVNATNPVRVVTQDVWRSSAVIPSLAGALCAVVAAAVM